MSKKLDLLQDKESTLLRKYMIPSVARNVRIISMYII